MSPCGRRTDVTHFSPLSAQTILPRRRRHGHIARDHRWQSAWMPELSRFLGIVIAIYYRDHAPPHFHAVYGEHEATIDIRTGAVTGQLPRRALSHVEEWRQRHEAELLMAWDQAQAGVPPSKIEPLE
jgi:hypothetical protein